jgi:hypothetical protein
MDTWRGIAARNNAEWCDVVCRSHGARTRFDDDAWTSPTRTPPYYPDAVTLVPDLSVPDLLSRIDAAAGCSIKDSFASLDLTDDGFRVLFDAQWIVHTGAPPPPAGGGAHWERVRDRDQFARWVEAWRGTDDPADVLRADLLDHDSVAVLAARAGDHVVGGAILNRSSSVVGISNFFADDGVTSTSWSGCLAFARSIFATATFVGYESGDILAAAQCDGFEIVGPLRVWIREDSMPARR